MASHTRYPGMKTPHGVYGAQYQHPPHLIQNPTGVANVIPASVMGPPSMTATSIYGVQPGHQVGFISHLIVLESFSSTRIFLHSIHKCPFFREWLLPIKLLVFTGVK